MKRIFPFWVLLVTFSLCILVCLLFLIMLIPISIFSQEHATFQVFYVLFGCGFYLETSLTHQLSTCIFLFLFSSSIHIIYQLLFQVPIICWSSHCPQYINSCLLEQYLNNVMWFPTFKPYCPTWLANSFILFEGFQKRLWAFMHTFLTQGWNCLK